MGFIKIHNINGKKILTIEDQNKRGIGLNICFKRYLAEYEGETEIDKTGLYKNSPYYFENKGTSNYHDYVSIYENIKNSDSKKLKLYKTSYKHRYAKKKGLSKLDCYCEKKIFDKIDYINNLAKQMRNDKKLYKKKIYNKFGYGLIILAILPFLGLVIPSFFNKYNPYIKNWCFSDCADDHGKGSATEAHNGTHYTRSNISGNAWGIITTVNHVFVYLSTIFVLFMVIYILIKVIKYERIKAGKGKIKGKDYYRFCKNIFI
ncbi:hypothetical protein PVIIG_05808 [Plasmodium vivax India VII]|uniref:Variable surface protein Vir35 n=1 Tax=Plasmodium vivax India VII TaxID=1077284 RepID=A0A0J9S4H6_PLAVI|nr:hypothetical protein PVIIG_05808 [Plasmodium vivax India VII]